MAADPDAESMVEQITYLTSWPTSTVPTHQATMEVNPLPTTSIGVLGGAASGRGVDGGGERAQAPVRLLQGVKRAREESEGEETCHTTFKDYSTGN